MQRVVPVLPVTDAARARDFYTGRLGFEVDWEWRDAPGEPAFLQVSRAGLSLYLSERPGDGRPGGLVYLYVSDVDAWYDELAGRSVEAETPPADRPWGNRECVLRDPDGNRLCLASVRAELSPDRNGTAVQSAPATPRERR